MASTGDCNTQNQKDEVLKPRRKKKRDTKKQNYQTREGQEGETEKHPHHIPVLVEHPLDQSKHPTPPSVQPSTNQDQPIPNRDQPNTNQDQPNINQDQPNTNQDQPNTNQHQPNTNQHQPNTNQHQPNTNQHQRNTNRDQPNTNQDQPNTNQHQPNTNQHQPNTNQHQPNTNRDQSNDNKDQFNTNQHQPITNQHHPNTIQHDPNTNQHRPNTGQTQPNLQHHNLAKLTLVHHSLPSTKKPSLEHVLQTQSSLQSSSPQPSSKKVLPQPPDQSPSDLPDSLPSDLPDQSHSGQPDQSPSDPPDQSPSDQPDQSPSDPPDQSPSDQPDQSPSDPPDKSPSDQPDQSPDESSEKEPRKRGDPSLLTVLTWNIDGMDPEHIKERFSRLLDYLKEYHPDVVLLQEVTPPLYKLLQEVLKPYQVLPGGDKGYFTAILLRRSRVLLVESSIVAYPTTTMARNLQVAQVSFLGRPLCVMTSHLESMRATSNERVDQLARVWRTIQEQPNHNNVIFGGDTNCRDWEVKNLGMPRDIGDVWECLGEPADCAYTWDLLTNDNKELPFPARLRFDRLFLRQANKGSKVTAKGMTLVGLQRLKCGCFVSDHWGVLCTFTMEPPLARQWHSETHG